MSASAGSSSGGSIMKERVAASLYGLVVGDALAMPVHWFYSPTKLRNDYGELKSMVDPKPNHAESMVQGMSYSGSIDIMHDKARFYEGNLLADKAKQQQQLTEEEIAANRDEHGNYVGATEDSRVHYHGTLVKGQNTANVCIARLVMRYLAEVNSNDGGGGDHYDPNEFLKRFHDYMVAKPNPKDDVAQQVNHNDTYLDIYLRGFFERASAGVPLHQCALNQREKWSIGSLDGVVMSIPIIAAYATEADYYVVGRAVEHHMLTHRSVTVTAVISVLVPLLLDLYRGKDLRMTLDIAMDKMRPPKITGKELGESYKKMHGPGNIPKHEKWLQHMILSQEETTKELVHRLLDSETDEDVIGLYYRDSRISSMCYCEQAFTAVLYLAYKYADNPREALLQNARLGGHSTARGAVLGAILGAAFGQVPFVESLAAPDAIQTEVDNLVATLQLI